MKRVLAGFAAGVVLASAGAAVAAHEATHQKAIPLGVGQAVSYAGLTCTTYSGPRPTLANLVCVRNNLKGFGVVMSQEAVLVAKRGPDGKVHVIFKAKNG